MRRPVVGVWPLYLLWRRMLVLRLLYGGPPVVADVKEDRVAILLPRRTALTHYGPQRGRRLEEIELRLEVLLPVRLEVSRSEVVGAVHEHL